MRVERLVWVEPCRSISVGRTAVIGASASLPDAPGEGPLTLMSEVNGRGSNQLFLPTGGFGIS